MRLAVDDGAADVKGEEAASLIVTRTSDAGYASSLTIWITVGGNAEANEDFAFTSLAFAAAPAITR